MTAWTGDPRNPFGSLVTTLAQPAPRAAAAVTVPSTAATPNTRKIAARIFFVPVAPLFLPDQVWIGRHRMNRNQTFNPALLARCPHRRAGIRIRLSIQQNIENYVDVNQDHVSSILGRQMLPITGVDPNSETGEIAALCLEWRHNGQDESGVLVSFPME
uniref:Uncharacterized protein n=1 Tax=Solibacter usitatus (strain Ellin6076) TaxID=234267 RepID=Q024J6_SOLUE